MLSHQLPLRFQIASISVEIEEDRDVEVQVLFEAGQSLSERNLAEQFRL